MGYGCFSALFCLEIFNDMKFSYRWKTKKWTFIDVHFLIFQRYENFHIVEKYSSLYLHWGVTVRSLSQCEQYFCSLFHFSTIWNKSFYIFSSRWFLENSRWKCQKMWKFSVSARKWSFLKKSTFLQFPHTSEHFLRNLQ